MGAFFNVFEAMQWSQSTGVGSAFDHGGGPYAV